MKRKAKSKMKSKNLVNPNPDIVMKWERFRRRCDYPYKHKDADCCGYYSRENPTACNAYNCPEVEWIVDNIEIMKKEEKLTYIS